MNWPGLLVPKSSYIGRYIAPMRARKKPGLAGLLCIAK
jgi:hypothetical protein